MWFGKDVVGQKEGPFWGASSTDTVRSRAGNKYDEVSACQITQKNHTEPGSCCC